MLSSGQLTDFCQTTYFYVKPYTELPLLWITQRRQPFELNLLASPFEMLLASNGNLWAHLDATVLEELLGVLLILSWLSSRALGSGRNLYKGMLFRMTLAASSRPRSLSLITRVPMVLPGSLPHSWRVLSVGLSDSYGPHLLFRGSKIKGWEPYTSMQRQHQ